MKMLLATVLVFLILLSCSLSTPGDSDEKLVEGTYVMQSKSEFSIADDTLSIAPFPNQKDLYMMERRVGYRRITDRGILQKERRQEKATAIWYAERAQLREQKKGRVYSLSADGKRLQIGSTAYRKISNP